MQKKDAVAFHEEDRNFHDYLMRAYGNSMITDFIARLRDRIEGINIDMLKLPGIWGPLCRTQKDFRGLAQRRW